LKRHTLFELAWILPSLALPFGILVAILVTVFGVGMHVPSAHSRIDPKQAATTPPFDQLGVFETGYMSYEVRMLARTWSFDPAEIRVPVGAEVTFVVTSQDLVHGMLIDEPNVNVMLIPGEVARVKAKFDKPGEYPIICHEYCGIAHQTMWARVIVEPAATVLQTTENGGDDHAAR